MMIINRLWLVFRNIVNVFDMTYTIPTKGCVLITGVSLLYEIMLDFWISCFNGTEYCSFELGRIPPWFSHLRSLKYMDALQPVPFELCLGRCEAMAATGQQDHDISLKNTPFSTCVRCLVFRRDVGNEIKRIAPDVKYPYSVSMNIRGSQFVWRKRDFHIVVRAITFTTK